MKVLTNSLMQLHISYHWIHWQGMDNKDFPKALSTYLCHNTISVIIVVMRKSRDSGPLNPKHQICLIAQALYPLSSRSSRIAKTLCPSASISCRNAEAGRLLKGRTGLQWLEQSQSNQCMSSWTPVLNFWQTFPLIIIQISREVEI